MKRSFYSERDYAFGQRILSLRSAIGLTQAGLAQHLGVSRHAVVNWEAGESYPIAEHLKALIEQECVLTETFDVITAVAISPDGQSWAASGRWGEVRVWEGQQEAGPTLHLVWQAHADTAYALAFSPDGPTSASRSPGFEG